MEGTPTENGEKQIGRAYGAPRQPSTLPRPKHPGCGQFANLTQLEFMEGTGQRSRSAAIPVGLGLMPRFAAWCFRKQVLVAAT